jgi:hypothetical protein
LSVVSRLYDEEGKTPSNTSRHFGSVLNVRSNWDSRRKLNVERRNNQIIRHFGFIFVWITDG